MTEFAFIVFIICMVIFGIFTAGFYAGYKECSNDIKEHLEKRREERQKIKNDN